MVTLLFSMMLSTLALAQDSVPAGCTSARNFSAEAYKVWIAEGATQSTTTDVALSKAIAVGVRTKLQLNSDAQEFRGFVNFEIPASGTYIIASDAYPRIELIDTKNSESLSPTDYGKVRDCGSVNKTLRFELQGPAKFQLGFISSHGPSLNVLVWPVKENTPHE